MTSHPMKPEKNHRDMTLSEILTADFSRYELNVDKIECGTGFFCDGSTHCGIRLLYTGQFDKNDEKEIKKIRSRLTRVKPLVLDDFVFYRKFTDYWDFHGIFIEWYYRLQK